jgi:hypothetical protein
MNAEIKALLIELKQHSHNPVAFALIKQKILQIHFDLVNPSLRPKLQNLQKEIEQTSAIAGTPIRAFDNLLIEFNNRCYAMRELLDEIKCSNITP